MNIDELENGISSALKISLFLLNSTEHSKFQFLAVKALLLKLYS